MKKKKKIDFWGSLARLILRNRIAIIIAIIGVTAFWSTQWQFMRFTFSEANLLPDKHPENEVYNTFLDRFGEEGNIIVIALQDSTFLPLKTLPHGKAFGKG